MPLATALKGERVKKFKPVHSKCWAAPTDDWKDEPAFIIGGGSSLRDFDFDRLIGKGHAIAVNNGWEAVPWAEYCFFADRRWWDWNHKKVIDYEGLLVSRSAVPNHGITNLKRIGRTNRHPISRSADCVAGFCGGANALNLAYILGANPIFLLGFDMYPGNWHDWHQAPHVDNQHRNKFIPYMEWMAEEIKKDGFRVYNTNLKSRLRCFPFIDLEELMQLDDLSKIEHEKYERVWESAAYRKISPGMLDCEKALGLMGMLPDDTLYDFGAGPGRATSWFLDQNIHATAIDIARNALEDAWVPFVHASLWALPAKLPVADWGYCCDVMEHIPREKVNDVFRNIRAKTSQGVYFNIATRKDNMGPKLIGSPLHLVVESGEWWRREAEKHWPFVDVIHMDKRDVKLRCMVNEQAAAK